MNNLRKWYKKHLNVSFINNFLKILLRSFTDTIARIKGIKFPPKYDWDWKLEMLMHKYEEGTVKLVKRVARQGMTIIDVGAHIGYYTLIFSKLTGKTGEVYAFEPEEENFNLLQKNVKKLKNVKITKKAVSDKAGFIDFYKAEGSTGLHSVLPSDFRKNKTSVESANLDNFVQEEKINNIDLIKIDIEGGEPYAFLGAKKILSQPSLMVIMEFTPSNFSLSGINAIDFLKNFEFSGFSVYKIKNDGDTQKINTQKLNIEELMNKEESINLFLKK